MSAPSTNKPRTPPTANTPIDRIRHRKPGWRHGKAAGYLVNTIEEGAERLRQGFRIVAYGGDLWLYRRALREGIEGLRQSVWQR